MFPGAIGGGIDVPQPSTSHVNPPYPSASDQNHLQPSPASGAHAPPTTPADPSVGGLPAATHQVPAGTRYTPPTTGRWKEILFSTNVVFQAGADSEWWWRSRPYLGPNSIIWITGNPKDQCDLFRAAIQFHWFQWSFCLFTIITQKIEPIGWTTLDHLHPGNHWAKQEVDHQ